MTHKEQQYISLFGILRPLIIIQDTSVLGGILQTKLPMDGKILTKLLANEHGQGAKTRPWFEWKREMGLAECPYLQRTMLDLRLFSIRLHHFRASDDDRALHDHPWWFFTLILKGGYTDVSDSGNTEMKQGRIYFRRAHHRHTVQVNPGGVWTLCLMGPKKRSWGFWVDRKNGKGKKFKKANKYFIENGHHPCE